jgi:hypothetical protein
MDISALESALHGRAFAILSVTGETPSVLETLSTLGNVEIQLADTKAEAVNMIGARHYDLLIVQEHDDWDDVRELIARARAGMADSVIVQGGGLQELDHLRALLAGADSYAPAEEGDWTFEQVLESSERPLEKLHQSRRHQLRTGRPPPDPHAPRPRVRCAPRAGPTASTPRLAGGVAEGSVAFGWFWDAAAVLLDGQFAGVADVVLAGSAGGLRIAVFGCGERYPAELLQGDLDSTVVLEGVVPEDADPGVDAGQHRVQYRVVGALQEEPVELLLQLNSPAEVSGRQVLLHHRDVPQQSVGDLVRGAECEELTGQALELSPDLVDRADLARAQHGDDRAAVRPHGDEVLRLELPEHLADDGPGHVVPLTQRALGEAFAGLELLVEDVLPQQPDDLLAQRRNMPDSPHGLLHPVGI